MSQSKAIDVAGPYTVYRICDGQCKPLWAAAKVARSFFSRLVGLLLRSRLAVDEALVIQPCNSVHTVGMRMAIAAVFIDRSGVVMKIVTHLKPGRFARCRGAFAVIETSADNLRLQELCVGDTLLWSPSC